MTPRTLPPMPMLPMLAMLAGGIGLSMTGLSQWWSIAGIAAALAAIFTKRIYTASLVVMLTVGFLDGFRIEPTPLPQQLNGVPAKYAGTVQQTNISDEHTVAYLDIDSVNGHACRGLKMAAFMPISVSPSPGRMITFTAVAEPPANHHDLPDEFDFEGAMKRRGVGSVAYVNADSVWTITDSHGILNALRRFSTHIEEMIYSSDLKAGSADFLAALLTGNDGFMDSDSRESFSKAGLAHILALSGLHVGIIAWIMSLALWPVRNRRLRLVLTIAGLWAYALVTGLPLSVVRAVLMATIMMTGLILWRRTTPLNSLFAASFLIILFSPRSMLAPGFQMSFMAALSILTLTPLLNRVGPSRRILRNAVNAVVVPFAAMAGTGIISVFYFHSFPVYFLISNIIVGVFVPVLILAGVLIVAAAFVGLPSGALCGLTNLIYDLMTAIVDFITSLPGATVDNIFISPGAFLVYFAAVASLALCLYRPAPTKIVFASALLTAGIACAIYHKERNAREAVYFLRNTSTTDILVSRGNSAMLITSATNTPDRDFAVYRANKRYADYLSRRGIDSITLAPDTFATETVSRQGHLLTIAGKTYRIITGPADSIAADSLHVDYNIFTKGFRGSITETCRLLRCDTVLLGSDLNRRRQGVYLRDLRTVRQPCKSLHERRQPVLRY